VILPLGPVEFVTKLMRAVKLSIGSNLLNSYLRLTRQIFLDSHCEVNDARSEPIPASA
jgi:hypothetical protein